jgi:hypothetical protein
MHLRSCYVDRAYLRNIYCILRAKLPQTDLIVQLQPSAVMPAIETY